MNAQHQVRASRRRVRSKVSPIGVALLLAGGLFVTANAPSSAQPSRTSLPTLRAGGSSFVAFDPAVNLWGSIPWQINANLVQFLPSGKLAPDLATWKLSKNHLVYTFTIRHNARFSNGHAVTAHDVAFSFKRTLAPSRGTGALSYGLGLIRGADLFNAGKTKSLAGMKVRSAGVLAITITRPAAYFLSGLSSQYGMVLDPRVVAGKPMGNPKDNFKTNYLNDTCTGNQGAGPFTFACHDGSSTLHSFYSGNTLKFTLVPNPYYYGHKPGIILEQDTNLDSYRAYLIGKADLTGVPVAYVRQWKGRSKQYLEYPSSNVAFIVPNVHMAPFNNVHCRRAVAYAINREFIAHSIFAGAVHANYAVVPKGLRGWYPGKDNPHYNPVTARAELAECPSRTIPFELKYAPNGDQDFSNEYSAIGSMLSAVGMNVKLKLITGDEWFKIATQPLDKSNTQLINSGWNPEYPDPQDYCTMLHSGELVNVGGWHNGAFDRLVDRANATPNSKKRVQLYIQAQHIALSQGAMISLNYGVNRLLLKPYVHGLIGSEAFPWLVPKNGDWANVSISKH